MPTTQNRYVAKSQRIIAKATPPITPSVIDQNRTHQRGTTAMYPPIAPSPNISREGRGAKHSATTAARKKTRLHITCTPFVASQTAATMIAPRQNQSTTGQEKKLSALIVMTGALVDRNSAKREFGLARMGLFSGRASGTNLRLFRPTWQAGFRWSKRRPESKVAIFMGSDGGAFVPWKVS